MIDEGQNALHGRAARRVGVKRIDGLIRLPLRSPWRIHRTTLSCVYRRVRRASPCNNGRSYGRGELHLKQLIPHSAATAAAASVADHPQQDDILSFSPHGCSSLAAAVLVAAALVLQSNSTLLRQMPAVHLGPTSGLPVQINQVVAALVPLAPEANIAAR